MEFKNLDTSNAHNLTPIDVTENKSGRFISLSVLLHAALVASVTLMSIPPSEVPQKDLVEFEVAGDTVGSYPIPDGQPVPETQGPAPVSELPDKTDIVKAEPVAKAVPAPQPKAAPKAAPAPVAVAEPVAKSAPATVDDIQAPELETSETGEVPVAKFEDSDLQEDFEKIDKTHEQALEDAKASLEQETEKVREENEAALAKIEEQNKARAKAKAEAAAEERRLQAAEAAAAAEAQERENAAAQAMAARAAAMKAQEEAAGTGGEGEGSGNTGSPEPTKQVAGIPGGVRSLEQLRQMPGNKFPQYSQNERLARQEGDAVFYAYVNKDGMLSQFKLGRSTGFKNLDGKTLAALKTWKFYPGQEGWVEMPFKWTLSGEAKGAGGQLRGIKR